MENTEGNVWTIVGIVPIVYCQTFVLQKLPELPEFDGSKGGHGLWRESILSSSNMAAGTCTVSVTVRRRRTCRARRGRLTFHIGDQVGGGRERQTQDSVSMATTSPADHFEQK